MYRVAVESSETIIPLDKFKEFARVTSSVAGDDQLMESLLKGAIKYCEKYTSISIESKTYEKAFKFGSRDKLGPEDFELRKGEVTSVVSITKRNRGQSEEVYDITDIEVYNYKQYSHIYLYGAYFSLGTHFARPFTVTFVSGYTEDTLPQDLETAIMQLALYWYENRETMQIMDEANIAEMPYGTSSVLNMYRLVRL